MIVQEVLNATAVRNDFSKFIDSVVHVKPQVVKRNRDVFWSFSQEITSELLSNYTISIEYEHEEDGSFSGSLIPLDDIVIHGSTFEEMIDDAAEQLVEYARDYYEDFIMYYNSPNRRAHLPFILNILSQEDLDGVKKIIRA